MSPTRKGLLSMEIDDREVSVPEGTTVLRAAELNDVYIPSLCSHKDLSPFGGCRMCVVEIQGMRGYPLACSTFAEEGMKVLTDTVALREIRREILQLILSEHPASCLICDEKDGCRANQYTVRKAGVTTGCRQCPNDGQCELQQVVEKLDVTEIDYPIYYRGYEAEHDDPFFDRDYNICILCGRCVRMCQEVRGTSVLAFKFRGPQAQIGPAFGRNHIEAGCEFCGACVSVCPTGTLAEKASKWDGQPDGLEVSTCPFCPLGCQVKLHHKDGRLSKVEADLDPQINDGQLCVRGRFCMPEATHHHERAKKPVLRRGEYFREVTWEESLEEVAGKLNRLAPTDFLMIVSGDLTNESLFTAQKFVRSCLGTNSIDSTARDSFPGGLGLWAKLFSLPISMKAVREADAIIAVGLDSRFYFSVAGVEIRHALRAGATLVTIDPRESNLAGYTDHWLRPEPGGEGEVLNAIAHRLDGGGDAAKLARAVGGVDVGLMERAVRAIESARNLAVVVAPTVFEYDANAALIDGLLRLTQVRNTTIMPLYNGANARGAFELGAMGEALPGVAPASDEGVSLADVVEGRANPRVIYLVGEVPFLERPDCDYVISQCIYPPPFEVDAFLPAASFAEADGTFINIEGRVQRLVAVEHHPDGAVMGSVRPDWLIFSQLAKRLESPGFNYKDSQDVLTEIARNVPGMPAKPDRTPRRLKPKVDLPVTRRRSAGKGTGSYLLVAQPAGFAHRGTDLSSKVEGLGELALEEGFRLNPADLRKLHVKSGERITISMGKFEVTASARADEECPEKTVYFFRPSSYGGLRHRANLEPLYRMRRSPVRVSVRKAGAPATRRKTKAPVRKAGIARG